MKQTPTKLVEFRIDVVVETEQEIVSITPFRYDLDTFIDYSQEYFESIGEHLL